MRYTPSSKGWSIFVPHKVELYCKFGALRRGFYLIVDFIIF
ncbi:MAG: hypothetical protein ACKO8W_09010 [Dolichospermum sp.]